MYCKYFEYDGIPSSAYNCAIVSFGGSSGNDTVSIGSDLKLNIVTNAFSGRTKIVSTQYDQVFSITFQIAKVNCENMNDYSFTEQEAAHIIRWLNKKTYKKFKPIYEDWEFGDMYMMGTLNVNTIKQGSDIVGFECTLTTNAPYAYYEGVEIKGELSDTKDLILNDISDETGYIYPEVTIVAKSSGKIEISNSLDGYVTVINNVTAGEIITLSGDTKMIESSISHPNLCDDFNYRFPKVINEDYNVRNVYSTTGVDCDITIKYSPVCKIPVVA